MNFDKAGGEYSRPWQEPGWGNCESPGMGRRPRGEIGRARAARLRRGGGKP